jgi:hypothetical protein
MEVVYTFVRALGLWCYAVCVLRYPSCILHLFPLGWKICFHDFFKFALTGKNLRKVEFT